MTKTLRLVKLTVILLTAGFLNVAAKGVSQSVTFTGNKVPLQKVFSAVEQQTGYYVFYNDVLLQQTKPITIEAQNVPLQAFMDKILSGQQLVYTIESKSIIISRKLVTTGVDLKSTPILSPPPPITVRGRILNEKGEPVVATVIIKRTSNGTTSDSDGNFILTNVNEDAVLVISGISIESREIAVAGQTSIIVNAVTKIGAEQEVTINAGYYTTTKVRSTASVVKIQASEIENQPVTSPLLALQGRVPGLELSPTTGAAGAAPLLRIRGLNSLTTNGVFPLYVIDGIPIDPRPITSANADYPFGADPLSTINVNNIESVEVLKDADATAIYGSRGANGVILIRTKKGRTSEKTNFDLNVYKGFGKAMQRIDVLNSKQYLSMRREAFTNANQTLTQFNAYDLLIWDTTRYTDWQKELLGGHSNITDIQANVDGGNATTTFRFGGAYHKETTIFPGDFSYQKFNGNLVINHVSNNKKFEASANIIYGYDKNDFFNGNIVNNAQYLPPVAPKLYDEFGNLNWAPNSLGTSTFSNPLAVLRNTASSNNGNLNFNGNTSYQILRSVNFRVSFGYSDLHSSSVAKYPINALAPERRATSFGTALFNTISRKTWIVEPQFNFSKDLNNHHIEALFGGTVQSGISNSSQIVGDGYTSDALLGTLEGANTYYVTDGSTEYRYLSGYARFSYDHQNKYIVNLSGRRDGSSKFGPGKRFGNFGSVAAGWIFSNESFAKSIAQVISFGKIRASYGLAGSDNLPDYKFYSLYQITEKYQNTFTLTPASLYNPNFKWETTRKLDIALEVAFFDNRIGVEVNWYRNTTKDQLIDYPLPETTGFTGVNGNFDATVLNTGWEAMANFTLIRNKYLKWTASANITFPKNKLLEFRDIENSTYARVYKIGAPLSINRQYLYTGVDPTTGRYTFKDINNDGVIDDLDLVFTRSSDFKYYGGITNTITFKRITLSFLFQFSSQPFKSDFQSPPGLFPRNQPTYVLNHWQKEGDETEIAKFSRSTNPFFIDYGNLQNSDRTYSDVTFWRLQTLSLQYILSPKVLEKIKANSATIFLQGQNLLTITNFNGFDPQIPASASPSLSIITLGIRVKI